MAVSFEQGEAIAHAITRIVGESNVFTWEAVDDRWKAQISQTVAPDATIAAVVFPGTTEELAAVITYAHQQQCPVIPCGNGSKLSWGGVVAAKAEAEKSGVRNQEIVPVKAVGEPSQRPHVPFLVVSTSRLNRLIDHAIGDLTVTVEAGMPFAELQSVLAKAGQFLAIDPTYPEQATIGGIVATADTGSLRQRYTSVRDMLLGITFVRADGQVAKAGGRVVKNVAGYDLMKLITGSYGTLGIVTQMTFRVYPLPQASQTLVLAGEANAIGQLSQTILQSALTPVSLDMLSASVVQHLGLGQTIGLAVRFQSIAVSVQEQISKVQSLGQTMQVDSQVFEDADDAALWQRLQKRMTGTSETGTIACKIGIQPSQAMVLLQVKQLSLPGWYAQIHGASGLGKLLIEAETITPELLLQVRAVCQENQGFLSVLQAPISLKRQLDVWGYWGNDLPVMRQIKHQFDPFNLLNPHRFVGGI